MKKIELPLIYQIGPIFGFMLSTVLLFLYGTFAFDEENSWKYVAYLLCALSFFATMVAGYTLSTQYGIVYNSKKWRIDTKPFFRITESKNRWGYNFFHLSEYCYVNTIEDIKSDIKEVSIKGTWYVVSNEPFETYSLNIFFKIVFLGYVIVEAPNGKQFIAKRTHFAGGISCLQINAEYQQGTITTEIITKYRGNPVIPTKNVHLFAKTENGFGPIFTALDPGLKKVGNH